MIIVTVFSFANRCGHQSLCKKAGSGRGSSAKEWSEGGTGQTASCPQKILSRRRCCVQKRMHQIAHSVKARRGRFIPNSRFKELSGRRPF